MTQSLSVTGFILFVLGILTLTPEIYLSGIMVMMTSAGITLKALEAQRIDSTNPEHTSTQDGYDSW